jgi:hypothetical protein
MPLPAQYASLDGLVDLLVEAMLREIQTPASEPLTSLPHDPEGKAIGRRSRPPMAGQRPQSNEPR